jgi:hypothetical protein
VQGQRLDLSLGLKYGDAPAGGQQKRDKTQKEVHNHSAGPAMGTRGGQARMKATGHVSSVKKAKPLLKRRSPMCGFARRNELPCVQLSGSRE